MRVTRIKELARERDLTIQAVADEAGLERTHLSKIAHGHVDSTYSTLRKIADVLEVTVDDLFEADTETTSAA